MTASTMSWHEVFVPRGVDQAAMTSLVRPLVSRPMVGFTGRVPVVTFEQWATRGLVRHLIGVEHPLGSAFIEHLISAVPDMLSHELDAKTVAAIRRTVFLGYEVGFGSVASTLRTDVGTDVSAAMGAALHGSQADATVVQWVVGPAKQRSTRPQSFDLAAELGLTPKKTETPKQRSAWQAKAREPLFAVRGRIATTSSRRALAGVRQALQIAESAEGRVVFTPSARTPERVAAVGHRRWGGIASAEELAVLLGWPLGGAEHAWQLPIGDPPPPLPRHGRPLGVSLHPVARQHPVVQPLGTVTRGTWLLGPVGSGKSHLMVRMALADIAAGRPVVMVDPKGDAVRAVMARLSAAAIPRTVFIDGGAVEHPVGVNPLAGPREDAERRADELVGVLRGEFGTGIGPRSSDVLLHTLIMAARLPDGTLPDVSAILTNPAFRRRVAAETTDPVVIGPWLAWFDGLSDAERSQVVAPVLNKLRAFLSRTNGLPSSVRDRLSTQYEVVLLLTRAERYYFDLDAIRVPAATRPTRRRRPPTRPPGRPDAPHSVGPRPGDTDRGLASMKRRGVSAHPLGKSPGDVWSIPTAGYSGAHDATFPIALAERCVLAGTPARVCRRCRTPWLRAVRDVGGRPLRTGELQPQCTCPGGWQPGRVLDPFLGAGTTAIAAEKHRRDWLGVELNPGYAQQARDRIERARQEHHPITE